MNYADRSNRSSGCCSFVMSSDTRVLIREGGSSLVYRTPQGALRVQREDRDPDTSTPAIYAAHKEILTTENHLTPIVDCDPDGRWSVMPLADRDGMDILDSMYRGRKFVPTMILHMARGIKVLHEHGIVHGDIKPDNLLQFGDNFCVCDYGLSVLGYNEGGYKCAEKAGEYGSLPFMAPELYLESLYDRKLTPAIDIYSLGIAICMMLTSVDPYTSVHNAPSKTTTDWKTYIIPRAIDKITDVGMKQLLISCCMIDPSHRPSITDVIAFLNKNSEDARASCPACSYEV